MLEPDFRDIVREFNQAAVEYLVVGAFALAGHGLPRATRAMDLWLRNSTQNARHALGALKAFGAPVNAATLDDLQSPHLEMQIGVEPVRVDILTYISGVEFDAAYEARMTVDIDGVAMPIIGRRHLIANKRATGRPRDLLDAEWLEQHTR